MSRATMVVVGAWLSLTVAGCGASTMERLPVADARAYSSCAVFVEQRYCSRPTCGRGAVDVFARQPKAERHEWLVRHGCPRRVVAEASSVVEDI